LGNTLTATGTAGHVASKTLNDENGTGILDKPFSPAFCACGPGASPIFSQPRSAEKGHVTVKSVAIEELLDDFEFLDTWEDRYRYIIELGDELEEMPAHLKTEENRVQGCVSNVWLVFDVEPGEPPVINFIADSDSQIVRGLVAILLMLCSGRTAQEVLSADVESVFEKLELRKHLSRSRSNGLHAMIKRIRTLAESCTS
jgi:cysteine desulfuration protein SufE